ncbi:MAG: NAD(P)/FAD-dependent oxidoreductase [Desulfatitalea sp.]|nr:FAD-dependent oxidoreductase [Desulfatitalea sp.]NNK00322.1 NAD(P)/FAD-dependent oxidoreductase [Desulfatitalea sp.]
MHYVIIGNGIAGINAAEAIRALDPDGRITLIGDESFPPYSRPMISNVLEGSQPHERLPIRGTAIYSELKITPVLGQRVVRLDVDGNWVELIDGVRVAFDRLLIASGADPRPINADGLDLANIFFMRTQAHVKSQLEALPGAHRALVLGGGLVGFKAAYGLLRRGLSVTMLISSDYPLSLQVDETAGHLILNRLLDHGLDVRVGTSVSAFEGTGRVQAALTDDGQRLACDLVVIGKGVRPAQSFVPRDRIETDMGILVDDHLQTSVDTIYAAGDVAESIDIARGCRWVNAIWPEAAAQGRIAGFNMAGRAVAYPGSLSRNVMRIYDLDVMTLGYANPPADAPLRILRSGGVGKGFYRSLVFRGNLLVGAILINHIEQGGVLRALIENGVPLDIDPAALMASDFNFAKLLAA